GDRAQGRSDLPRKGDAHHGAGVDRERCPGDDSRELEGSNVKRTLLLAAAGLLAVALAACGSGASLDEVEPVEGVSTVAVDDNVFEPRVITIPAGTEVTWEWEGGARHNVVGDGGF